MSALALASVYHLARAQTAEAGRIEDRLPSDASPSQAPALPSSTPTRDRKEKVQPFTLTHVNFRGGSVFHSAQMIQALNPFVGSTIDEVGLEKLANTLTDLYRARGYFLSRAVIPPQEIRNGVLQIDLIEAYISDVEVSGLDLDDAKAQFSATLDEHPARLQTFERELLLLSDRFGINIEASQLLPDLADPARFSLRLKVALKPVSLRLYTDNRGTTSAGPQQLYASASFNSIVTNADRLTGSLFFTPEDTTELSFASANYSSSWLSGRLWTELDASVSQTQDSDDPYTLKSMTSSERLLGKISVPVVRSRAESLWLGLSLEHRSSTQDYPSTTPRAETLVMIRGSLALSEVGQTSRADLAVEGTAGIDGFGASENGAANLSLDDARPQFTKIRINASGTLPLWTGVDLQVQASGQLADGALPVSEEFGFGGARFGRAFAYSSLSGDSGWAAGLEVRYTTNLSFGILQSAQAFVFADMGGIQNLGDAPSGPHDETLASIGTGLRLVLVDGLAASVEAARGIGERSPSSQGSTRFFFSLSWAM